MNTKKNIKLLGGLILAGCFLITQPAVAQSWGGWLGTPANEWVINSGNSNHWTSLRLQTDNDRAWNMVNQEYLWWGYAENADYNDRGTERMRLTNDGRLTLTKPTGNDPAGVYFAYDGNPSPTAGIQAERDLGGANNGGLQLFAHNTRPIQFLTQSTASSLSANDEAMRITGDGNVGIGTTSPSTTLDVNGTGHFGSDVNISGNLGIGTTNPSTMLDVAGTSHFGGNVGIGTTSPERSLHVRGNIIRIDRDATSPTVQLVRYGAGYTNIWKVFDIYTDASDVDDGKFVIADRGDTTGGEGAIPRFTIDNTGNIGIGISVPTEKLEVDGNIKADGVVLDIGTFPDYVFEKDYPLMPLSEVEKYINANKHLPGFPSEAEVVANGANLGELNNLLVEKVEELTLHTIAQEKLLTTQEKQINRLLEALNALQAEVKALKKQ